MFFYRYYYYRQEFKYSWYLTPKMTNSTSTDVTFGEAWLNRVVSKQEDSHSTAPADKQINE